MSDIRCWSCGGWGFLEPSEEEKETCPECEGEGFLKLGGWARNKPKCVCGLPTDLCDCPKEGQITYEDLWVPRFYEDKKVG